MKKKHEKPQASPARPAQAARTAVPPREGSGVQPPKPRSEAQPGQTTAAAELSADRNVDQIRDILFGGQMKDYERRFRELSQKLDLEMQRVGDLVERKFSLVEKRLDEQGERLTRLIRQESGERGQQLSDLDTRLQQAQRALRSELQAAMNGLELEIKAREERIRESLSESSGSLLDRFAELASALTRTEADLREDKVGRIDLAAMLNDLALRIGGDLGASETRQD